MSRSTRLINLLHLSTDIIRLRNRVWLYTHILLPHEVWASILIMGCVHWRLHAMMQLMGGEEHLNCYLNCSGNLWDCPWCSVTVPTTQPIQCCNQRSRKPDDSDINKSTQSAILVPEYTKTITGYIYLKFSFFIYTRLWVDFFSRILPRQKLI
jgi:hypothetical protein